MNINKPIAVLFGVGIAAVSLMILMTSTAQASTTGLELSCPLIPLDYSGFSLDDIQDNAILLNAADATATSLFNVKDHAFTTLLAN